MIELEEPVCLNFALKYLNMFVKVVPYFFCFITLKPRVE